MNPPIRDEGDNPSTNPFIHESTDPFDSPGHRTGKIAHLPRPLRERVNRALYHRCAAKKLVKALNEMPEVKAVLAEHFGGRPVSTQNIYEWKWNGYRDWLHRRQILENKSELAADARDLANTAPDMADSLFGMLTLDYAHLMMKRDGNDESFEKKRKALSTLSQDIVRLYRCRLNARRIQVQETKLDNETEKTEEQLHFKFREWTQNPDVRKALILAPMEADRQMRILNDLPPAPEDPLVERETRNDPWFGRSDENKTRSKPDKTKKSNNRAATVREREPNTPSPDPARTPEAAVGPRCVAAEFPDSTSVPTPGSDPNNPDNPEGVVSTASTSTSPAPEETRMDVVGRRCRAAAADQQASPATTTSSPSSTPYVGKTTDQLITEAEDNYAGEKAARALARWKRNEAKSTATVQSDSEHAPQPAKRELSPYEKALLEGKTFIEALYAQFTPAPKPKEVRPEAAADQQVSPTMTHESPVTDKEGEANPLADARGSVATEPEFLLSDIERLMRWQGKTLEEARQILRARLKAWKAWRKSGSMGPNPMHAAPEPNDFAPNPGPTEPFYGPCDPPLTSASLRNLW